MKLSTARKIKPKQLRRDGLEWYAQGDNADYLASDILHLSSGEADALERAAADCFAALRRAAKDVAAAGKMTTLGVPAACVPLIEWSLEHEWDDYFLGRFDFAGGLDGLPIRLIEFNADTASLLPETAMIQALLTHKTGEPRQHLFRAIEERLTTIRRRSSGFQPFLALAGLGHPDDRLNLEVIFRAARPAGFEQVVRHDLPEFIFDPAEGMFYESGAEQFDRFDFWYKFIPWDWIAVEEPELWQDLAKLVMGRKLKVLNPAWAMLLQSKALLAELSPSLPYYLPAARTAASFRDRRYVSKPIFGRMGENITLYNGGNSPEATTDGDFGDQPLLYQGLADFNESPDGELTYQASVYFTDHPCALAFRRQDEWIIDDDAEFVAHVVD